MTELGDDVIEEAVRLTRQARRAVDEAEAEAYRRARDELLADHDFLAHVRTEEGDPVLVCYPADWTASGVVDLDRIDDFDRAVERPLTDNGDADDWASVDAHNRELVATVAADHGPVHAATVDAFADFMGNHYARRIETAGRRECREFLEDYLPRNAWPSDEQVAVAETSLRLAFEAAGADPPDELAGEGRRSRPVEEECDDPAHRRDG